MTEYQFLIISQINVIKRILNHQVSLSQLLRVSKYCFKSKHQKLQKTTDLQQSIATEYDFKENDNRNPKRKKSARDYLTDRL